jgi:hypothetical protein
MHSEDHSFVLLDVLVRLPAQGVLLGRHLKHELGSDYSRSHHLIRRFLQVNGYSTSQLEDAIREREDMLYADFLVRLGEGADKAAPAVFIAAMRLI